jgi:hypothetical protein
MFSYDLIPDISPSSLRTIRYLIAAIIKLELSAVALDLQPYTMIRTNVLNEPMTAAHAF